MKLQAMQCPNCKAPVEPIEDARFMFCPYCGTKILIDDIEYYKEDSKTKREKIKADRDVRKVEAKANAEVRKSEAARDSDIRLAEKEAEKQKWNSIETISMMIFGLLCIAALLLMGKIW